MRKLSTRLFFLAAAAVCLSAVAPRATAATSAPFQILTRTSNPIVWQNFGNCLMITEDLANGRSCYYYDYVTKSRTNQKSGQAGWQPLGSAIKWLMYVCQYQGLNRLMANDVDHNVYYIARPSPWNQVGCGFCGNDCFYGQYRPGRVGDHYPVDIYVLHLWGGGAVEPFCISDSDKGQFSQDANTMVYCAHYGPGDDRICGLCFTGGGEFTIAARKAIHPTVCGSLVAWAEPSGVGFNILAKNLATREMRTVAYTKANPACPEAGRGAIFWEDARNAKTGLDIYGYDWATGTTYCVTNMAGDQVRLRACGDLVTWVSGPKGYEIVCGAKIAP